MSVCLCLLHPFLRASPKETGMSPSAPVHPHPVFSTKKPAGSVVSVDPCAHESCQVGTQFQGWKLCRNSALAFRFSKVIHCLSALVTRQMLHAFC